MGSWKGYGVGSWSSPGVVPPSGQTSPTTPGLTPLGICVVPLLLVCQCLLVSVCWCVPLLFLMSSCCVCAHWRSQVYMSTGWRAWQAKKQLFEHKNRNACPHLDPWAQAHGWSPYQGSLPSTSLTPPIPLPTNYPIMCSAQHPPSSCEAGVESSSHMCPFTKISIWSISYQIFKKKSIKHKEKKYFCINVCHM